MRWFRSDADPHELAILTLILATMALTVLVCSVFAWLVSPHLAAGMSLAGVALALVGHGVRMWTSVLMEREREYGRDGE